MVAVNYAQLLAVANKLIADSGQRGAVRRVGPGTGSLRNPGKGAPTNYPADFVLLDFTTDEVIKSEGRVLATDKKALLAPGTLPIAVTVDDKLIEADGTPWNIIPPVKTLRPATTTLLYTLQVRG